MLKLEKLTKKELLNVAKRLQIVGRHKMNKAELISALYPSLQNELLTTIAAAKTVTNADQVATFTSGNFTTVFGYIDWNARVSAPNEFQTFYIRLESLFIGKWIYGEIVTDKRDNWAAIYQMKRDRGEF